MRRAKRVLRRDRPKGPSGTPHPLGSRHERRCLAAGYDPLAGKLDKRPEVHERKDARQRIRQIFAKDLLTIGRAIVNSYRNKVG